MIQHKLIFLKIQKWKLKYECMQLKLVGNGWKYHYTDTNDISADMVTIWCSMKKGMQVDKFKHECLKALMGVVGLYTQFVMFLINNTNKFWAPQNWKHVILCRNLSRSQRTNRYRCVYQWMCAACGCTKMCVFTNFRGSNTLIPVANGSTGLMKVTTPCVCVQHVDV